MALVSLDSEIKINYMTLGPSGDGPVIVMIHGLASSFAFWMPASQVVASRYRVLLYDQRGHGRSSMPRNGYTPSRMAEDLQCLLDHLAVECAVIVGHSFGGSVATEFAYRHPDRVRALVLADARLRSLQPLQNPGLWPHWPQLKDRFASLGLNVDENDPEGGYVILTQLARLQVERENGQKLPPWMTEFFGQGGSRFTASRWLKLLDETRAWDELKEKESFNETGLCAMRVPALGVYGERSPVMPTAERLQQAWPHLRIERIPDVGHFFPLSRASAFVDILMPFLGELETDAEQLEES